MCGMKSAERKVWMSLKFRLHTIRMVHNKFINYSYLGIDNESKSAFVIDPAWDIQETLTILKDERANLKSILLTHSHFDHMNKAVQLANLTNSTIYISQEEYEYYKPKLCNVSLSHHKDQIKIGNTIVYAYLTPGHTKGSMCYKAENLLFTGDTLFIEGCGICNADGGNPREMFESLQFLKSIIKEGNFIYPGHAFLFQVGQPYQCMQNNIYMNIEDIDKFISFRMRKDQNVNYNFI